MRCFIIDDEQPAINILQTFINNTTGLELVGSDINPISGIKKINELKPDVVFLDIQMDEMNGLEVVKHIPEGVKVVFCTAYSQFAVDSYDLNAVDYLMKPVPYERFLKSIEKVEPSLKEESEEDGSSSDYMFFAMEQKGRMGRIEFDDIDYIEAMSNYMCFVMNGKKVLVYVTMKELEAVLPKTKFMRIHKSFIIYKHKVELIEKNSVKLFNYDTLIPIGENYRTEVNEKLKGRVIRFN